MSTDDDVSSRVFEIGNVIVLSIHGTTTCGASGKIFAAANGGIEFVAGGVKCSIVIAGDDEDLGVDAAEVFEFVKARLQLRWGSFGEVAGDDEDVSESGRK